MEKSKGPQQPLRYLEFIKRLRDLDVCIPVLPSQPGTEFMMYAEGGIGYSARPSGPRCAFMHREDDEQVPVKEINAAIGMLRIPEEIFWGGAVAPTPRPPTGHKATAAIIPVKRSTP